MFYNNKTILIKQKLIMFAALTILVCAFCAPLTAQAKNYAMHGASFGLVGKRDAIARANVRYVIDGNGNASEYAEYILNGAGTFYVPFLSKADNIPVIEIKSDGEAVAFDICYGERYVPDAEYNFYPTETDGEKGTLYTIAEKSDNLQIEFEAHANQSIIYNFDYLPLTSENKVYKFDITQSVQTEYRLYVIGGKLKRIMATAEVKTESLTLNEFVDRVYTENAEYFKSRRIYSPEVFYAYGNGLKGRGILCGDGDLFIKNIEESRVNAYRFTVDSPCTVTYKVSIEVPENKNYTPAIYMIKRNCTLGYPTDYVLELNAEPPYVIESVVKLNKSAGIYTAKNADGNLYFVYSSDKNPEYVFAKGGTEAWKIVFVSVISGITVCAVITIIVLKVLKKI